MAPKEYSPYTKSPRYYDFIYLNKSVGMYQFTVDDILLISKSVLGKSPDSLLDIGCGTGNHAVILKDLGVDVVGFDLSEEQIQVAKEKAGEKGLNIEFQVADMTNMQDFSKKFDIGACFFSSFCYLLNDDLVLRFLNDVYEYINEEGFLYFEFWNTLALKPGTSHTFEASEGDFRLIRSNSSTVDYETNIITMPMHHLLIKADQIIDEFTETHKLRTYTASHLVSIVNQTRWKVSEIFCCKYTPLAKDRALKPDELRYYAVLTK